MSKIAAEQRDLENDYEVIRDMVDDFSDKWGKQEARGLLRVIDSELFGHKDEDAIVDNKCSDCGEELPDPTPEPRDNGYTEMVTYCKCGATYTS